MTAVELVSRLVLDPLQAPKLLAKHRNLPGISQAVFEVVIQLYSEDHGELLKLKPVIKALTKYGDDLALSYRCLGIAERCDGRWKASADAFIHAGALAEGRLLQLSYPIGAIDGLARSGQIDEAIHLGRNLVRKLKRAEYPVIAARARLNLGYALMQQDRYHEAIRELSGIDQVLNAGGYPMDAISSQVALSTSLLFGGKASAARQCAVEAEERAEEAESFLLANIAKGNAAYTHILGGEPDLAVSKLLPLKEVHRDEPVELARVLEYLGDAYTAMNLHSEAIDAFQEALAIGKTFGSLHLAHLHYGLGRSYLSIGKPDQARGLLTTASNSYRKLGNKNWELAAKVDLAVAEIQCQIPRGNKRLEVAVKSITQGVSPWHHANALISSVENGGSATRLIEAARLTRRWGLSQLDWRIEMSRAVQSSGANRLRRFRKMFQLILADQARTSSVSGRLSFYIDKQVAIRGYLGALLQDPTRQHVQEAVQVIVQTRSVTLLDEVLMSKDSIQLGDNLKLLTGIREELNHGRPSLGMEGSRRTSNLNRDLDRLRRIWLEGTHTVGQLDVPEYRSTIALKDSYLYLTGDETQVLNSDSLGRLPISESELEQQLDWLNFDIIAPLADPSAPCEAALNGIKMLGEQLLGPVRQGHDLLGLCPDGQLWRVPWLACADLVGLSTPIELRLHPGLKGFQTLDAESTPMVWVAEHADLPRAKDEAEQFLKIYPNARICRSANEVRSELRSGRASILHVISHSRYRPGHPMFSSLDFTDGPIVAAEIARSGFRVGLVTLSGCDTARLSGVNRLEPDGLVRAFLACGAGYVVGSAWPLDDEAAMKFYTEFYEAFVKGINIHDALRTARCAVREWKKHPYYWGFPLLYAGYQS